MKNELISDKILDNFELCKKTSLPDDLAIKISQDPAEGVIYLTPRLHRTLGSDLINIAINKHEKVIRIVSPAVFLDGKRRVVRGRKVYSQELYRFLQVNNIVPGDWIPGKIAIRHQGVTIVDIKLY